MKRALRSALRSSSPSTRARRPPLPVSPGSANIAAVGNQLSRFSSQRGHRCSSGSGGGATAVSFGDCCPARSTDSRLAPLAQEPFFREGGSGRGRGRERRARGEGGDARFDPRSSGAVATAAAALAAAAAAAGGEGKHVDCEYPEGTKFEDVYFCSGKALGSGEWCARIVFVKMIRGVVLSAKLLLYRKRGVVCVCTTPSSTRSF